MSFAGELLILIALYSIIWQGYKLRRRISGFAHVALLVFVLGTLCPQIASAITTAGGFSEEVGTIVSGVAVNIPIVGLFCFKVALEGRRPQDPRVLLAVASGLVISVVTIVLGVLSVRAGLDLVRGGTGSLYLHPTSGTSALLNSTYRVVMITWVGLWVFPFTARPGTPRRLKIGMRIAAVGLLFMAIVPATGLTTGVATIIAGEPVRGSLLTLMRLGQIVAGVCWAAGLSYPLIGSRLDAWRARRTQRHDLARVAPLWETGLEAFPEVRRPTGRRESLTFELQRRKGECYDCLHHLRLWDNDVTGAGSPAAAETLRAAFTRYEDLHGETVWSAIDRNRNSDAAESDMTLLVELSDLVVDLRSSTAAV